jgi:hypothetical protein
MHKESKKLKVIFNNDDKIINLSLINDLDKNIDQT